MNKQYLDQLVLPLIHPVRIIFLQLECSRQNGKRHRLYRPYRQIQTSAVCVGRKHILKGNKFRPSLVCSVSSYTNRWSYYGNGMPPRDMSKLRMFFYNRNPTEHRVTLQLVLWQYQEISIAFDKIPNEKFEWLFTHHCFTVQTMLLISANNSLNF